MKSERSISLASLVFAAALVFPGTVHAAGINLSWDDCGTFGTQNKAFACNSNSGAPFKLVGSFVAPPGISNYIGMSAQLRVAATTLPDWWKIGTGQCRSASVMSAGFDFQAGSLFNCNDVFLGNAAGGLLYDVGYFGPNTARIIVQAAVPTSDAVVLDNVTESYAFSIDITRAQTAGPGSCAGCSDPVRLTLNSIQLFQPDAANNNPIVTNPINGSIAYWQGVTGSTPDIVSFVPGGGAEGTTVTISGAGLTSTSAVRFGGVATTPISSNDTQVQASVPVHAKTGLIELDTPFGTAASDNAFTVAPVVTYFVPTVAPIGSSVRLYGRNFTGTSAVTFGSVGATFSVLSDTEILTTVPAGAVSAPIFVTNGGGIGAGGTFVVGAATGGINLAWNDCGVAGESLENFACDTNFGPGFTLVGSFVPPPGITNFLGVTSDIKIAGTVLPDWWKHGTGQCRFTNGMSLSFDYSGQSACTNPYQDFGGSGLLAHSIGFYGPETARLRVMTGIGAGGPVVVAPDREYYAYKVVVASNKTTGLGMCTGCDIPVSLQLQSIQIERASGTEPVLALPLNNTTAYWQGTPGPLPVISAFTPPGGPVGTPVTITGTYFTGATAVRFGSVAATFSVVNDGQITTTVPTGAQSAPILVSTPNGTASTVALFYVNPVISDIVPPIAPVGTTVAIRGTGMAGTSSVTFNGTPAVFTNISDGMITAVVPGGATTGPVVVTNPGGASPGHLFTVGPLPTGTLDLAWDDCGSHGVTLKTFACDVNTGSPFPLIVSLRPPAGIVALTKLTARIKVDAGQIPDWWKHGGGECRGFTGLTSDLSASSSCGSPWVSGTGASYTYSLGFYGAETALLQVEVLPPSGQTAALNSAQDQLGVRINVQRNMTTGAGSCANCSRPVRLNLEQVELTQNGLPFNPVLTNAATQSTVYWQGTPQPAPVITASVPAVGAPGNPVSIRGLRFTGATSVRFRGTPATFTVPADTAISTTVPAGAHTGPLSVETLHGVATSAFTFIVAPVITALLPDQAPIGTTITLLGFNFTGATLVMFNGTVATFAVQSDSVITATVPAGTTTGSVSVMNAGGFGSSPGVFTVGPLNAGIDLSWADCGFSGTETATFACNTNTGTPFSIVGSFRPPSGILQLVGLQATVQITSSGSVLPDWWRHGSGQCRGSSAMATSFDFVTGACTDPFPGTTAGTQSYAIGFYGPNTAQLLLQCSVPPAEARALNPGTEYYAFRTSIARSSSAAPSGCAGCNFPVRLDLQSIQLIQTAAQGFSPTITTPLHRTTAYWQGVPGPAPTVTATAPPYGPPGTPVHITGHNFTTATAVLFQNLPATFTVQSDSVIITQVPSPGRTGKVSVVNPNGIGQSPLLFYVDGNIQALIPSMGPVGRGVYIFGTNFTGLSAVTFNGTEAPFTAVSDTAIYTTVPEGATTGYVAITTPAGVASSPMVFTVTPGPVEGINLSWFDCGTNGATNQTFACNANAGAPFTLVASFQAPSDIREFLGISAEMFIRSGTASLPDWWRFGTGQCRGSTALSSNFDFTSGPFSCIDAYNGQAAGGYLYEIGFGGPNQVRLRIQAAIPIDQRFELNPGDEYYAFKTIINRSKTVGTGSCSGCSERMEIELTSIQLFQPAELNYDPVLVNAINSQVAYWQGVPTPPVFTFSPPGGAPGAAVTLQGSGFTGTTKVEFGNIEAGYLVISDQTLTTNVPAGARTAPIRVTTPTGVKQSSTPFYVAPEITGISPAQAPGGAQVGIEGINFTGTTAVRFGAVSTSFSIPNDGLILASVPASLPAGPVTVTVQGIGGSDTAPFTVGPLLTSEGINLAWDDCGNSGTPTKTFACDVNSGGSFPLVASYTAPTGLLTFLGLEAMITIANPAGVLPDWWKHGSGFCRGTTALTPSFDFTAFANCADFFAGQAAGGLYYAVGGLNPSNPNPSRAQVLVQAAIPFDSRGPLTPGIEYYAFRLSVNRSASTGTGACAGCAQPMCIELNRIKLYQDAAADYDPVLELPAENATVTWQNPPSCGSSTPVQVSIVLSEAHVDHNRIVWEMPRGGEATVYRREGEGAWRSLERVSANGEQRVEYVDDDVRSGITYRYRLGFLISGEEIFGGETSLTVPVPARTFALSRIGWSGKGVTAMVILPTADPASLEVFDLSGRRTASKRLEGMVGEKRVDLATHLSPGVYFGRLTQNQKSATGRFVVVQ